MTEEPTGKVQEQSELDPEAKARREFLTKVGQGTATIPALVLLLAASSKESFADRTSLYGGGGCGCGCGACS